MKNDEMRWICDECGEPIGNREGGIHLYNLKPKNGRPKGGLPSSSSRVGIKVVHTGCDEIKELGYWISVDRAETAEEWLEIVAHVAGKTWCRQMEFMELSRMWRGKRRAVVKATS